MLHDRGLRRVAGVDEAGRGPLAGPVVAAAVVLPPDAAPWLGHIRDSKRLPGPLREELFDLIHQTAVGVGTGVVDERLIDGRGIAFATRLAMKLALRRLHPPPESILIDFLTLPGLDMPQRGITHGDDLCLSIACASIVAKVTRDRLMERYDRRYPGYGFGRHKGYGTPEHLECLRVQGPCPIHRRSFEPVKGMMVP